MIPCSVCKKPVMRKLMREHLSSCLTTTKSPTSGHARPEFPSPELHETSSLQVEVVCSYCEERTRFDSVVDHMQNHCRKRPIPCAFCKAYVAAYKKPMHEANCNQRPGTCPHCKTGFQTILEERHYKECLKMPVNCSFEEIGCTFRASLAGKSSGNVRS